MRSLNIPFQTINWAEIAQTNHQGISGSALWQTATFEGLRIRKVSYSPGYLADHWCSKGHIVHCLSGQLDSELKDGTMYVLKEGMTYIASDNTSLHRSSTEHGVSLLIIDGDFLK